MSLLNDYTHACFKMIPVQSPDGQGGLITRWSEDTGPIMCAITLNQSLQARIAEREGLTDIYTITVAKDVNLYFHDILKDGDLYYRITSHTGSGQGHNETPASASINMRQYKAERYDLNDKSGITV